MLTRIAILTLCLVALSGSSSAQREAESAQREADGLILQVSRSSEIDDVFFRGEPITTSIRLANRNLIDHAVAVEGASNDTYHGREARDVGPRPGPVMLPHGSKALDCLTFELIWLMQDSKGRPVEEAALGHSQIKPYADRCLYTLRRQEIHGTSMGGLLVLAPTISEDLLEGKYFFRVRLDVPEGLDGDTGWHGSLRSDGPTFTLRSPNSVRERARRHYERARFFLRDGNDSAALEELDVVLKTAEDFENLEAVLWSAGAHERLGQLDDALRLYKQYESTKQLPRGHDLARTLKDSIQRVELRLESLKPKGTKPPK